MNARSRRWAGLALLLCAVLVVSIDNTVLGFATAEIARDLHPEAAQLLWIVDSYSLTLAALLVAMGAAADRFGRRRMLLLGAWGFTVFSVCAAFAPSAGALIAARVLMGVFGAMLMPSSLSIVRSIFADPVERSTAIALWSSCWAVGAALGPILGGVLLGHAWWGAVFLIAVPLFLPLLLLGRVLLPESRGDTPARIDARSVLLCAAAMGGIVYALKRMVVNDSWPLSLAILMCALLSGWAFARRQQQLVTPLLDLQLLRNRSFRAAVLVNLICMAGAMGQTLFAPQQLQLGFGLPPMTAAWYLVPGALTMTAASLVGARLAMRWSRRSIIAIAMLVAAAAFTTALVLPPHAAWGITLLLAATGIGFGAATSVSNELVVTTVPSAQAAGASAISETSYEVGAVFGATVLGGLLTAGYQTSLHVPEGIDAPSAHETFGGAVDAASQLPVDQGEQLFQAAQSAFTIGGAWLCAGAAVAALIAALIAWRGLRPSRHDCIGK